jgi:hypothetical protein
LDRKDRKVFRESKAFRAKLAHKAHKEFKAQKVKLVHKAHKEFKVQKVKLARKDHKALLVQQEHQIIQLVAQLQISKLEKQLPHLLVHKLQ